MTIPRPIRRLALTALVLALAPIAPRAALASNFWVKSGGGSFCTHTTLQAAIDAAQSNSSDDNIYLVGSGPFTGPFSMLGAGGITIVGGVASCGSGTSTQHSTLQAPSGKRPLTIFLGQDGRITLRRLILTTNFGTLANDNGGGLWFIGPSSDSEVVLDDSKVINNGTLKDGGGIFVSGGRVRLTGGSIVSSNTAANGGGIAAINDGRVEVDSSTVAANTAYFDGGGIYAPAAVVHIGANGGLGLPAAVANNIAGDDGGGLYLGNSHALSDFGAVALTSISGNQARHGGGIFMDDAWASLYYVDINLNTASQEGGGVYLTSGSLFETDPFTSSGDGFPHFSQNKANDGAVLYASGASTEVALRSGTFSGHDTRTTGAALVTASDSAHLYVRGMTAYANLAPEIFAVEGGASLLLHYASITGNTLNRIARWDGSSPGFSVANSIFAEAEPFFSGLPTPKVLPELNCVVSQSPSLLQGLPAGTDVSRIVLADPQFVAPEHGDLHISPKSPAVDLCHFVYGFGLGNGYDFDKSDRGFDEPFRANSMYQTFDAGADEVVPIVWDDFESGLLSQHWPVIEPPSVPSIGNNLQITTAARLGPNSSQRGLQLTLVNPGSQPTNNTFVVSSPTPYAGPLNRLNGSFFLDPQGLTMSSTPGFNRVRLLSLNDHNGDGSSRLLFSLARSSAEKWSLEVSYRRELSSDPVVAGSAFFACAAQPCGNPADWRNNLIELQWRGGIPAHLDVWRTRYINNVPNPTTRVRILSLDLPMPGALIDSVSLGKLGVQSAGTFGQIFFDEVSFTH